MSVADAVNYTAQEEEDYYALLSCSEDSTVEQITVEYKCLALQYHPDKNQGDKEAERKFQLLNHAKEVLCDPEKRKNYDAWRRSGLAISYKQWRLMKDNVHQTMHWSTPKMKDRMLGDGSGEAPGSPGHGKGQAANSRRASDGSAAMYYGRRHDVGWDSAASNETVQKFRTYKI